MFVYTCQGWSYDWIGPSDIGWMLLEDTHNFMIGNAMKERLKINVVGAGNVGKTLGRLTALSGQYKIQDIMNRTEAKASAAVEFIQAGRPVSRVRDMRPADIWLVTTGDSQIAVAAAELAREAPGPSLAVHCSGFLTSEELKPLQLVGWQITSAHPVFSFANPETSVQQFPGTLCAVEGDAEAVTTVKTYLESIGARSFPIRADAKVLYHGAAVIANNLTRHCQVVLGFV